MQVTFVRRPLIKKFLPTLRFARHSTRNLESPVNSEILPVGATESTGSDRFRNNLCPSLPHTHNGELRKSKRILHFKPSRETRVAEEKNEKIVRTDRTDSFPRVYLSFPRTKIMAGKSLRLVSIESLIFFYRSQKYDRKFLPRLRPPRAFQTRELLNKFN